MKLMMDSPQLTQIHCSQNVPRNSPMEVTIKNPVENHIHASQVKFVSPYLLNNFLSELSYHLNNMSKICFISSIVLLQSVPMGSPLTFTIEGEDNENQIEVVQSAPDDYSPLEVKLI